MKKIIRIRNYIPLFSLILIFLIFTIISPKFMSIQNLVYIISQVSPILIAAIGVTFIILMGAIDLSVVGAINITSIVFSMLVLNTNNSNDLGFYAIPIALLTGGLFGFLNGLICTKGRIPSFMVTLGTGFAGVGLAIFIYKGNAFTVLDDKVRGAITGSFKGIPFVLIIMLVVVAITVLITKYTRFGRYIYAIGGDENILKIVGVGISIAKYKILAFTVAGILYGIAGVVNTCRIGGGTTNILAQLLLYVIAAVVIGGTPLTGGIGGPLQTVVGGLIIGVIFSGMLFTHASSFVQDAIIGGATLVTVAITFDRSKYQNIK